MKTAKRQNSAVSPGKDRSRSPSPPFIKWKPLRKPMEKAWEEEEEGGQSRKGKIDNRVVSYRSPSPPKPVPPPSVKARASNLPKYMLDGRVAYYICK